MDYPIGIQTFEKIVEGGYVYVDKTELVYQLTQENSIYFLSVWKESALINAQELLLGEKRAFQRIGDSGGGEGAESGRSGLYSGDEGLYLHF